MAEILKDEKLTAEDKQLLHRQAQTRFWHRRMMAYLSLFGLLGFSTYSVVIDPTADVAWVNGTLAAIILGYYGVSAIRPGS